MKAVIRAIDACSAFMGKSAAWLTLAIVLLTTYLVIEGFAGLSQVHGGFEMQSIQLFDLFAPGMRGAGRATVPERSPALRMRLLNAKHLQALKPLLRLQRPQRVRLIDTGHAALLVQIRVQLRILQGEGAGLGETDKAFRLLIRGRKQQPGVLAVHIEFFAQLSVERVAHARSGLQHFAQAVGALSPLTDGAERQTFIGQWGIEFEGRPDNGGGFRPGQ